jgi:glycosyltransferase involved in cell wall biosynthesis
VNERRLTFALPGDPRQRTGGYIYDARLTEALVGRGWHVHTLRLPDSFPLPTPAALADADRLLAGVAPGSHVVIDGLALGAMPEVARRHASRLRVTALVHHPLGYETGHAAEAAARLVASEREALAAVGQVIVTSTATGTTLVEGFGVPAEVVTVAVPGTDPAPVARGSDDEALHLLAVGSIIPRKDFPSLVEALAGLRHLAWRLSIVGSLERSVDEARRLHEVILRHGLGHRIVLEGELAGEALERAYDRADLLVSVSRYEGFGMAIAEGIAHGLPIVAVAGGAVGSWLTPEAALLVPPDDPAALQAALETVIGEPRRREALRLGALVARDRLPSWAETAEAAERAILATRVRA